MQCQSYFPLYYTHNDLNMDTKGITRPVYTGHVAPTTGHSGQRFLASPATQGCLGYNKEFLRQTILNQEVTFRAQVQELHRLYRRQKELLDEIKRDNFYKEHVRSEAQWFSNSLTSNVSVGSTQRTLHSVPFDSLPFSHPSSSGASNLYELWTSSKGQIITTASHTSQAVTSSNIVDFSLFHRKGAQKKLLDLQLPADEYINGGKKEYLKDREVYGAATVSSHCSSRAGPVVTVGNVNPLLASNIPTNSSQMTDLTNYSGSKPMSNGFLHDYQNKKKLKLCEDIENDKIAGKSRSTLCSSGWHSYSQSLPVLVEAGQAHQTTHSFEKDGLCENGRRNTDAKVLGSIDGVLNLNIPGNVDASHSPIFELPAPHSHKVNSQVPLGSSPGQLAITLEESLITRGASCLSTDFSGINDASMRCTSQGLLVDGLDYSSRCRIIHEKARSLQSSRNESQVKASASSGFLFQGYKCGLASAHNQSSKHLNQLDPIDLNSTGVAHIGISSAHHIVSKKEADDLTSPKSASSQVFPSSDVFKKKHIEAIESQPNHLLRGSFRETASLGSINNADEEQKGQIKKFRLFDINLPCDPTMDMVRLEDDSVGDDYKQSDPSSLVPHVKDDQLLTSTASPKKLVEVDLKAPISPEKRESCRPRGESEENNTETSLQASTGKDEDFLGELMKTAVDVLISISSSEAQQQLTGSEQCLASSNDHLIWFAGVVCSMELGDGFSVSNSEYSEKCEENSSSSAIDYFEAMTLKLTSQEDYWCGSTALYNKKEACDMPMSNESSRGKTTRRVKSKNFQREVLPSLASLSRYEVSEDIQIMESLMKDLGLPCKWVKKTRKVCRIGRPRGRKKSCVSTASGESRTCLLALPHASIPALDLKDKGRVRWEIMPRRPRGQRSRTISPHITLSQEGWMRKWGGNCIGQKAKKKHKRVHMLLPEVH